MKRQLAQIALGVLIAAISAGVTHAMDVRANSVEQAIRAEAPVRENPLQAFETRRQQLRARQREQLSAIIYDASTDAEVQAEARGRLLSLMETEEQEETIQGILRARGFSGAVASVSGGAANVLVPAERLNRQQTAVILELVLQETGLTGGNVKIIPIN